MSLLQVEVEVITYSRLRGEEVNLLGSGNSSLGKFSMSSDWVVGSVEEVGWRMRELVWMELENILLLDDKS